MRKTTREARIFGTLLSHNRLLLSFILLFTLIESLIAVPVATSNFELAVLTTPRHTQQCDTSRRIIDAWFLHSNKLESPLHPHGSSPSLSLEFDPPSSDITACDDSKSWHHLKSQIQLTASLHAFIQFRLRCNVALSHLHASNSTGIWSATDAEMEDLCQQAFEISSNELGGSPSMEPLLLLGSWYILRGNLTAAHSILFEASREQADVTALWNIGSNWDYTFNRSLIDSQRLILLAWTRYHTGNFDELDHLYPEMHQHYFHQQKWMTLLQDRVVFGDLLRWQEKMSSAQTEKAKQMLATWRVYCQQDSMSSHLQSCQQLLDVVHSAGLTSEVNIIETHQSQQSQGETITNEQLLTEFPNLLAFVKQQSGQPERDYEFEPITVAHDAASLNASLISAMRFYHQALLHIRISSSSSLPNQLSLIVLNPAMRFTTVWEEHSVEFLNRLPRDSEFDMALFDMDTLVLPQCAKMLDKGQQYWAQILPGSIALKANAILLTRRGAEKLLLRRSGASSSNKEQLTADTIFTNPPFYCRFGHNFTLADFIVLYPIHPILMESYTPTELTELIVSNDRNGDGVLDKRDVRVKLVLSKFALKPNQTEIDSMHRLNHSNRFQLKSSPAHPSTYRERPNESASWYSIHSADEAALCLTENWSMGSPRWLRWSDQCAEVGIDFWWIIRSVHPPSNSNSHTTNDNAPPPAAFDPKQKGPQYVTLEGSRGSYLFVQSSTSSNDDNSVIDPFLRMREFLHSPAQKLFDFAPPECSVFRVENGQIFTCFDTSLMAHSFYHELEESEKPVLMIREAPLRNFSRTINPAIHKMTEVARASAKVASVRFTPVLNNRKLEASLAHSYAQLPVRRIVWAMWTQGTATWPLLMKHNVLSWNAVLNGVDSSNATNRVGDDYLGVNSTDPLRWEIRILNLLDDDEDNLFHYVDRALVPPRFMELSATNQADVARQLLLLQYGGIWLDISVFLLKPPEWLVRDGPALWNSFYLDDRYHSVPHGKEYFQGLELWASGSGVHSYIVEQNFLAQARTMMDLPRSTAIWLHPLLRNIDFSVMDGDYNYFRMNLLMVKCLQDDPLTRALFVSHGNVRDARSRTGGYHWLSPFINPWLNETHANYRWDFESAKSLLIDPQVHAQDQQAWVKDIVQHDHMIEIPTGMAWTFRNKAFTTSKTNLGYILRQPLQLRRKIAYQQAEAQKKKMLLSRNKP